MTFVTSGRNRYQVEVPEAKCSRLPSSYELKSQRKGYQRWAVCVCVSGGGPGCVCVSGRGGPWGVCV